MARCPYLEYESNNAVFRSSDKYICGLCGQQMDIDDSRVKNTCNPDYGSEYEKCPVYKNR